MKKINCSVKMLNLDSKIIYVTKILSFKNKQQAINEFEKLSNLIEYITSVLSDYEYENFKSNFENDFVVKSDYKLFNAESNVDSRGLLFEVDENIIRIPVKFLTNCVFYLEFVEIDSDNEENEKPPVKKKSKAEKYVEEHQLNLNFLETPDLSGFIPDNVDDEIFDAVRALD